MDTLRFYLVQANEIDYRKLLTIETIHKSLTNVTDSVRMSSYERLYEEYRLFHGDSAFTYANRIRTIAAQRHDNSKIADAQLKLAFVLLAKGMLEEAADTLIKIRLNHLPETQYPDYYFLLAKYYYDRADYGSSQYYRSIYDQKGNAYADTALMHLPTASFKYRYIMGLMNVRAGNLQKGRKILHSLLAETLSHQELALAASTLSDIYIRSEIRDSAIVLLAKASICDIKVATKENSALYNLARILFQSGDIETASLFIQKAYQDANFYGSQKRKAELGVIMPIINQEQLRLVENEKRTITTYAVSITVSCLVLFVLLVIIFVQIRKLRNQQSIISEKNSLLTKVVNEKEWLLKEVNHRVKNNLQTIVGLLESQSFFLKNDALEAVRNSQHRIYAMALIHNKLYQDDRAGSINMLTFLPELVKYLADSFDSHDRVTFQIDAKSINLDIARAIPLALILNEAITNSIKYAFPAHRENVISIIITESCGVVELTVSDNGRGFEAETAMATRSSLGLKLMKGLAEDIGGEFQIVSNNSTIIKITFKYDSPPFQKSIERVSNI